jgi:hypothetical protein
LLASIALKGLLPMPSPEPFPMPGSLEYLYITYIMNILTARKEETQHIYG